MPIDCQNISTVQEITVVRKWGILYNCGWDMLRRQPRDFVDSVGGSRRPESCGCTVRCAVYGSAEHIKLRSAAEADVCI